VDNFDMEFANSDFAFLESLKGFGFDKDLSLGVVDSHTHKIETVEEIEARIRAAIDILPAELIWPDPDCGLKTRTVAESMDKMRNIALATKRVRETLPSHV
jgi:5-methyltetrahydropteroyltriglutamate--homocysteine methyltransferase